MEPILTIDNLNSFGGNMLRQGDKSQLKYRLRDVGNKNLGISSKPCQVRMYGRNYTTVVYETSTTVSSDNTVTFTINKVLPKGTFYLEFTVGDYIFPTDHKEFFEITPSGKGMEANIIEIVGVDAVVRKAVDLINEDPSLIIDEDKLVTDIISNTGIGNINEYYKAFNDLKPKAEQAITKSAEALTKSQNALNVANGIDAKATNALSLSESADTLSKSVQEQFNQVIIDGDSSVEAAQARVDASGQTNSTLKERLDKEHNEVIAQLAQTVDLVNDLSVNVKQFGAKGDGVTDDSLSIQNAIDSLPNGGVVFFPAGNYLLKGVGSQLLLITKPIRLVGTGQYSRLMIDPSVPGTTDVIRISPSVSSGKDLAGIEGLQIIPVSGTPARHGVHFDVSNTGQYLARYLLSRNMILPLGGWGVYLSNPTNNDGWFCGEIEKNLIYGGMYFQRLGDSVRIIENTLAGKNIGVHMSGIHGACQVMIRDNNITTSAGAIRVDSGDQVKIIYNQIEQVSLYEGTVDATVYLGNVSSSEIIGNNITGHGNVAHNIRISQAYRTTIDRNKMRQGLLEMIKIDSQSNKTDIGYHNYYISATETELAPSIMDNGIGTMGVTQTMAPENGFENVSGTSYNSLGVRKDATGRVYITGSLNCGNATKTPGTTIANLPVGFRPTKSYRLNASVFDSGAKNAVLLATPSGKLQVETLSATATRLDLDGLNFQAIH